ncbi:MAG: alpha/beta hydrolase [Geodermatophilaceae bacterium]|nr:alpha/beta hydrolase [Geodermatophilaceae bacterium]
MNQPDSTGYAAAAGVAVYWESRGHGGPPLVVVHGGFGLTTMFGDLLDEWAVDRQVVAIELQGHGHTRDVDRPLRWETLGDQVAGVVDTLGLGPADLLGYSLGGGASLRAVITHPDRFRRVVLVATTHRRDASYPEVLAAMDQVGSAGFAMMSQSPMYRAWSAVAPDPDAFPTLMDKAGELLRQPYDWSAEIRGVTAPTMLVYGDADSVPPSAAAEFFALLGGGLGDPGWDGAVGAGHRLAVLPGRTHYDVLAAPLLGAVVADFLA